MKEVKQMLLNSDIQFAKESEVADSKVICSIFTDETNKQQLHLLEKDGSYKLYLRSSFGFRPTFAKVSVETKGIGIKFLRKKNEEIKNDICALNLNLSTIGYETFDYFDDVILTCFG